MMKRAKSIESRQKKFVEEKAKLLKKSETEESLKLVPLSYHAERSHCAGRKKRERQKQSDKTSFGYAPCA